MKKRVLIFIVSYNAEKFIEQVLDRIPAEVWQSQDFDTEVLIIDDASQDQTVEKAFDFGERAHKPNLTVLHNPRNQGYGGNQKIGYHYAVEKNFDAVVLLHGDGQYAPEFVPQMIRPILEGQADVVLGSRMIHKFQALKGRMPLYKWLGNQILTALQNWLLGSRLAEFHTGYRAFSVPALASIPFRFNSDYFDFDTDILIQLLDTGKRVQEISIPTFYGEEISRVNGLKYGYRILKTSFFSRFSQRGVFYHPKFDYTAERLQDTPKFSFASSHRYAAERVAAGTTVLDLACGAAFMAAELAKRQVKTISVDKTIVAAARERSFKTIEADLEQYDFADAENVEAVLMLDILEHLKSPEVLLNNLRNRYSTQAPEIIVTTANVGFFLTRLGLTFGHFNYSRRGILDLDHARLFTFSSLRRLLTLHGYDLVEARGIPAPLPLSLGNNWLAQLLLKTNQLLILLSKRLFAYQIMMVAKPRPTLRQLLQDARGAGQERLSKRLSQLQPDAGKASASEVGKVSASDAG